MMKMGHISALLFTLVPLCTLIIGTTAKKNNGIHEIILRGNKGSCPAQRQYVKLENEICHELCRSEADCPKGQTCCSDNCHRMCKPAPKVRPGTCPTFEVSSSSEPCNSYCSTDAECRENWKCCKKGCGYTCTPTLSDIGKPSTKPKASEGFCAQEKLYTCLRAERHYCNAESCMDGYKCCPQICRMECKKPLQERVGECPAIGDCPPKPHTDSCLSDHDCPEFEKCCPACGKQCVKAVKIPSLLLNGNFTLYIDGRK